MRHRFGRYRSAALGFLLLIETFGLRAIAHRKVGGLDEGPREVFVAALPVALSFLLAVRDSLTVYATTVGSEMPDLGKTLDASGLQHDRQR